MYVDSFLYGSMGYLYPSPALMHPMGCYDGFYTIDDLPIERNSISFRHIWTMSGNHFSGVLSTLVSPAVPFWIMVLVAAFLFKRRQYKALVPLLAAVFSCAACFWLPYALHTVYNPLLYLIRLSYRFRIFSPYSANSPDSTIPI